MGSVGVSEMAAQNFSVGDFSTMQGLRNVDAASRGHYAASNRAYNLVCSP